MTYTQIQEHFALYRCSRVSDENAYCSAVMAWPNHLDLTGYESYSRHM